MDYVPTRFYNSICNGVKMPKGFSEEIFRSAMDYKPRPGEIFIVTYPRSGTTWMHYIVLLILRRGRFSENPMGLHSECPYLEMIGSEAEDYLAKAGVARSHFPYHRMPMSKEAKYIYVCRDSKDCAVSFYHLARAFPVNNFENGTFDGFFEYFINGDLSYGDYFDHVTGWYEHRNDPNIHIVTYESIKRDPKKEILKISKFIGEKYEKALLEDPSFMENVLHYSSFEYMKKHTNAIISDFFGRETSPLSNTDNKGVPLGLRHFPKERSTGTQLNFVRKGEVGDWRNYFNSDQLRRLEEKISNRAKTSNFLSLWKCEGGEIF